MNWKKLYFGPLTRSEIQAHVHEQDWQRMRLRMKGTTTEDKYTTLLKWLEHKHYSRSAQIQVTNYVTALSRGGIITPSDYQ